MDIKQIEAQQKAALERSRKEGFASFMDQPMVRGWLSLLPPSEHIELLLRAAYEAGHSAGTVLTTIEMMKMLMTDPRERR